MNLEEKPDKNGILFIQLIISLHTTAMQQLGKLADPVSGKINRDLKPASSTIDILNMLSVKCRGNLSTKEENLISQVISELKLNYVDECDRHNSTAEETKVTD